MLRDQPSVMLVVPCYNEASRLRIGDFRDAVVSNPRLGFVLVDDGSRDRTPVLLGAIMAGLENQVRCVRLPRNLGKAEAVRAGMQAAMAAMPDYVGYWDADLATPISAVWEMAEILDRESEARAVLGARVQLLGRVIQRSAVRHYVGRVFATVVSMLLGVAVYDTQCGAKLFRLCPEIRAACDSPFKTRWVFDVELLARLFHQRPDWRRGRAIIELPLHRWSDVRGSKIRIKDGFRAAIDLVYIYREMEKSRKGLRSELEKGHFVSGAEVRKDDPR